MELSTLFYFLVTFPASVVGAICGIGGGVIIKPLLDLFGTGDAATVSFLSGCTVLMMSLYSVERSITMRENQVEFSVATPLAIGAAIGGVIGKQIFSAILASSAYPQFVGFVQSVCLALVTCGTLVYTLCKNHVKTHRIEGKLPCVLVGLILGIMSSFLGIGGGPINLVVLFYLFSMDTKTAAQNSLYIILFSQFASLVTTLVTGKLPEFEMIALLIMILGGVAGGIAGRTLNQKLTARAVDKLFVCLMVVIIGICVYNALSAYGGM